VDSCGSAQGPLRKVMDIQMPEKLKVKLKKNLTIDQAMKARGEEVGKL
jgi:hypothetical protein